MVRLTPDSESLREANDCHTPAGSPQGGQFCSKDGGISTKSAAFKEWFGDSQIIDSDGNPLRLYHGTLGNFDTFEPGTIESDMGSGIYFTDTPEDANRNYSTEQGPDVRIRINDAQQRISDALQYGDENTKERVQEWLADHPGRTEEQAVDALAYEEVRAVHGGATIPVYLRMERPAVVSNPWEPGTFLDVDQPQDEDGEYTGEPTGKLVDFIDGLRSAASDFDGVDADGVAESLWSLALDSGGVPLAEAITHLRQSQELMDASDPSTGKLASTEIIRRALEHAGFDGVIDKTVSKKWKMAGMHPTTTHYIVFHPSQVKSALGNRGTYSRRSNRITEALREFNPCHSPYDGRFATRTAGRCLGAAIKARRDDAVDLRNARIARRNGKLYLRPDGTIDSSLSADERARMHHTLFNATLRVRARSALARGTDVPATAPGKPHAKLLPAVPGYMRKDAAAALKRDRAVAIIDPHEENPHARIQHRMVRVPPNAKTGRAFSRTEALSVLRHELGHVSPRKINATRVVGLQQDTLESFAGIADVSKAHDLTPKQRAVRYVEEVRAWRNAIHDSGGKVSRRVMRAGLRSYANDYFGVMGSEVYDTTIRTLERYLRVVRSARKGAK